LQQLTKLRPDDRLAFARLGRVLAESGDTLAARAAFDRAGDRSELVNWYRHGAAAAIAGGRWPEALALLELLAEADPNDWRVYADRWAVAGRLGRADGRDADLDRAVRLGADPMFLAWAADALAEEQKWAKAAELLAQAAKLDPTNPGIGYRHGLACLLVGDAAGYRAACARLLVALSGQKINAETANTAAMLCALGPGAVADWRGPVTLIEGARTVLSAEEDMLSKAASPVPPEYRALLARKRYAFRNTAGAVYYRAGRASEAIQRLHEAIKGHDNGDTVHDWIFLAMAHRRLGQLAEADRYLTRARAAAGELGKGWGAAEVRMLLAEAERTAAPERLAVPPRPE
jgi:tetratricopeptide (TPR) repeat protein